MAEHLNLLPRQQVLGREQLSGQLVQMDSLLEEAASHNTEIPLRRLVDHDAVVEEVVRDEHPLQCYLIFVHLLFQDDFLTFNLYVQLRHLLWKINRALVT